MEPMQQTSRSPGDRNRALDRRQFLGAAGVAALALAARSALLFGAKQADRAPTTAPTANHRYKIAACDWMMLKRQTPGAITRAKEVGCDGVETDMGPLSKNPTFDNKLLKDDKFREDYLALAKQTGIEICSIAMSGYYAQSFPERPFEQPIKDCLATMKLMGVKVAFLPLGVYGDLVKKPEVRPAIVERLKTIGPWAEEAGVVIGIETSLDAAGEIKLLEDVGSPAIKIYYNFENAVEGKRDLISELKLLGKDRICQIHPTNKDVHWLQDDPDIDMPKAKQALDEMGWRGWLVIERSRRADRGRDVIGNFSANARYLKKVFQEAA